MKVHVLKCWPSYFEAILKGQKKFEVRYNDRDYAVGDRLRLREWNPGPTVLSDRPEGYTNREVMVEVTYVMPGGRFGLSPDFVVMSIDAPRIHAEPQHDPA